MIQWIKPGTNYDFMGAAPRAIIGSATLILFCYLVAFIVGPRWGIDFSGGTEIQLKVLDPKKGIADIRAALGEIGLSDDSVQQFGEPGERTFQVRVKDIHFGADKTFEAVKAALVAEYGADAFADFRFDPDAATEMEVIPKRSLEPRDVQAALVRRGVLPAEAMPPGPRPTAAPTTSGEGADEGAGGEVPEGGSAVGGAAGPNDASSDPSAAVLGVPAAAPNPAPPAPPGTGLAGAGQDPASPGAPADGSTPGAVAASGEAAASAAAADPTAAAVAELVVPVPAPIVSKPGQDWVERSPIDPELLVVRFPGVTQKVGETLAASKSMGKGSFEVLKVDSVGPKAGKDLREKAILSLVITSLLLLVYIAFRFDMSFAPGAIVAVIHDVLIAVGLMLVLRREIGLDTVGAALTILGYSVNDTIVVYDRIRENIRRHRRKDIHWIINRSINETLSRSILTSFTVLLVVMFLVLLGGPILRNLALCLVFGVIAGSYSTIFIASPVIIYLSRWFPIDTRAVARVD